MLTVAILVAFIYAFIEALSFVPIAGRLPLGISAAGAIAAIASLVSDTLKLRVLSRALLDDDEPQPTGDAIADDDAMADDDEPVDEVRGLDDEVQGLHGIASGGRWLAWIGGLFLGIVILGMLTGSILFLIAFLHIEGKMRPRGIAIGVVAVTIVILVAHDVAGLQFPDGILLPAYLGLGGHIGSALGLQ